MGLLQLQYFKALAEREHLTDTARELMVSAPSLSATIARLENDLGVQLFDRVGRNIQLNSYGRIYLKHVNDVFASLDNARREILDEANQHEMRLSIAISSPIIWNDAFQIFIKNNPKITLSHTIVKRDLLENNPYCQQFDFVITATSDLPGSDWESEILILDDRPVFAVYPNHPFAQKKSVRFIDAKDENFIVISKGFSMRKFFEDLCQSAGFDPKIIMECDYMLRSKMLAAEYGIVMTTESGARAGVLGDAVFVKIIDPGVRRTQAIFWSRKRYLTRAARIFLDFMAEYHHNEATTHPSLSFD